MWTKLQPWVAKRFEGWTLWHWVIDASATLAGSAILGSLLRMNWFHTIMFAAGLFLALAYFVSFLVRTESLKDPIGGIKKHRKTSALVQNLRELKDLAGENAHCGIGFWPRDQASLSADLASMFELAGWEVNYNPTAQEGHALNPWFGIEVQGFNEGLVNHVAKALRHAVSHEVTTKIDPITHRDPTKRKIVPGRVRLKIGHKKKLERLGD